MATTTTTTTANSESEDQSEVLEVRVPVPWGFVAGRWYGDRARRPLLALHGWQDNAGSFARLAPLVAPHRPVLALDLPGHGRSSHYPAGVGYKTLDYVALVRHVMRVYGWARVSLLGHSMGAAVSFNFAAVFPQLVDTVVALDVAHTRYFEPRLQIAILHHLTEKLLVEDERLMAASPREPPLYSFGQLEQLLHEGSEGSVELAHCRHILERSVARSARDPARFEFARDGRVKLMWEHYTEPALRRAMAQRIRGVNYLVLRAGASYHLAGEESAEVLAILRANNPVFEFHVLPGAKHHLHLNDPEAVARLLVPFVLRHPPAEEAQQTAQQPRGAASKL